MVLTDVHAVELERRDVDYRQRPRRGRFHGEQPALSVLPGSFSLPEPPRPPDRGLPRRAEINEVHDGQQLRVLQVRFILLSAWRLGWSARDIIGVFIVCVCCSETRVSTLVFTRDGRFMGGKLSASENLNLKKVEGVHARVRSFY